MAVMDSNLNKGLSSEAEEISVLQEVYNWKMETPNKIKETNVFNNISILLDHFSAQEWANKDNQTEDKWLKESSAVCLVCRQRTASQAPIWRSNQEILQ